MYYYKTLEGETTSSAELSKVSNIFTLYRINLSGSTRSETNHERSNHILSANVTKEIVILWITTASLNIRYSKKLGFLI